MSALYLDASALVKRYVAERYAVETNAAIAAAESVGTVMVSRAELAAAFSQAVRLKALTRKQAAMSLQAFRQDWVDLVRIQVTETVMVWADNLAWQANLRGYGGAISGGVSVARRAGGARHIRDIRSSFVECSECGRRAGFSARPPALAQGIKPGLG